jgi:hypothetical protein
VFGSMGFFMLSGLRQWFGFGSAQRTPRCRDCNVAEGDLHAPFCTQEPCPFCAGQLVTCGCIFRVLNLSDAERESVEQYVDDTIEPLRSINLRWEAALNAKGRVPFIEYPIVCAKCGVLRPQFFRVADEEWARYIQLDMRNSVLCRPCFDHIKRVTESGCGNGK